MRIDVHQHVWTAPLVEALEGRSRPPFVRWDSGLRVVHAAGEAPSAIDLDSERSTRRLAMLGRDGIDRALVAISSTLGIEALPRPEADQLIEAHLDGVTALGAAFGAWGPLPLDRITPEDVDAMLARGCVGVSLPAGALMSSHALDRLHPVLKRIEAHDAPLFVHPGPGLGERVPEASLTDPLWWPAMTRHVTQMQSAWLTVAVIARLIYPGLRVIYAMLAGGAPLLTERLLARGGPSFAASTLAFYDTSSYGSVAIEAMADHVGHRQLVYGSDRPVTEPQAPGDAERFAVNAAWLPQPIGVAA